VYANSDLVSNAFASAVDELSSDRGFGNGDTFSRMTQDLGGACYAILVDINGVCTEIVREMARWIPDDRLNQMRGGVRSCGGTKNRCPLTDIIKSHGRFIVFFFSVDAGKRIEAGKRTAWKCRTASS
jgi:hypothetical protein